jgi:hypothetical protein
MAGVLTKSLMFFPRELDRRGLIRRMGDASFFTGHSDTLSVLSLSEQAVYVRLSLMSENGKVRGRYEDIARLANVSLSTFKRVVKSLSERDLVEVVWRQKTPSLFILKEKTRGRAAEGPKLYDSFTLEDRDLFLFAKPCGPASGDEGVTKRSKRGRKGCGRAGISPGVRSGADTEV